MAELNESKPMAAVFANLMELAKFALERWWAVLGVFATCTFIGLSVGLYLSAVTPKSYEATATVFPISGSSSTSSSSLSGLAALAGVSLGGSSGGAGPGKTVNAILKSRLLIETLVRDMGLVERMKVKGKDSATREGALVESLRYVLVTKEDPGTGVVSVSVTMGDPLLAQEIANRSMELLDRILAEKSFTSEQKRRQQLDRQIQEQERKVAKLQQEMAAFQRETVTIDPKAQATQTMSAYSNLVQQKMMLELQLATAESSYSPNNPRVIALQNQISSLENQIVQVKTQGGEDLPSLKMAPENLIRYQDLYRQLEIATTLYTGLLGASEKAKLESDSSQIYVEVLDRALLPKIGKPSRVGIMIGATLYGAFVGLFGGVLFCYIGLFLQRKRKHSKAD